MILDAQVDQERHYEAREKNASNGAGRMELTSWEEDMGKERKKNIIIQNQQYIRNGE